jgi:hypothetical protein
MITNLLRTQIKEFWKLSDGKESQFNFNLFIGTFLPVLEDKLASHGQLSYEKYLESITPLYDFNILNQFVYTSIHTDKEWSFENIRDLIFRPRYEHFKNTFGSNARYINLLKLYNKIKSPIIENIVLLVDECIHALHNSGFLIDIEQLRKEYES